MRCGDFVRVEKGILKKEMPTAHGKNLIDIDDMQRAEIQ